MLLLIVAAGITVIVSSVCSLFEAVLYSTRMGALEAERESGRHAALAQRFIGMKSNIAQPTSAILVVNTIANTAGATVCGMYATQILGSSMVPAVSALLTIAILFAGEILPKSYGATRWRTTWPWIVWPLAVMQRGLGPVIKITQAFANALSGSKSPPTITEDEIQANIRLGRKAGELSRTELQLLDSVFHFDEMSVNQVMVPRKEVVYLDVGWSLKKCLEVARESRHSRFPLCDGSLDEAVGLVHVKDLLRAAMDSSLELRSIARPLPHIPETLPISRLLRDMQQSHQHIALVDDEYSSVIGVVTMENVVEQLVGTIQDEFDSERPEIVPDGPRAYKLNGRLPLERVNRECGLNLYSSEVKTISGLLVSRLGRLLRVGDSVQLQGAVAEVMEEEAGRATLVRIRISDGNGSAA